MASNFPTTLDVYTTLVDNVDDVLAAHANDRGDAIKALEAKVGINSSAVNTSIDYFLKHASGAYRTHVHDGGSDDGAPITEGGIANAAVNQSALKTTTGEVTATGVPTVTVLPGGQYGFHLQSKVTGGGVGRVTLGTYGETETSSTYRTLCEMYNNGTGVTYAIQRYVTASGEDMWVFLLVDKNTKDIIKAYQAPDAPHYGNGGDYNKVPHPFGNYNPDTQEIILLDKETANLIKSQATADRSILTIINEDMKVDYAKEKVYEPLHSGKFLTKDNKQVKEMVTEIAPYIKVKSLIKMTSEDKAQREAKREQQKTLVEQKKQDQQAKLNILKEKLKISDEELELLRIK